MEAGGTEYWRRCRECQRHRSKCWGELLRAIDKALENTDGDDRLTVHVSKIEDTTRLAVVCDSDRAITLIEQDLEQDPENSCKELAYLINDELDTLRTALKDSRFY